MNTSAYKITSIAIGLICTSGTFWQQATIDTDHNIKLNFGIFNMKGRRPSMEDAHTIQAVNFLPDQPDSAFFAIYDGHGGKEIADFCAKHAGMFVQRASGTLSQKLTKGLLLTDHLLEESSYSKEAKQSGSCVIAALIKGNILSIANIGDSRAVLARNGKALALSQDHKPDRDCELARIEALGAKVEFFGVPRIGGLAVSRAIGDHELRPLGVICQPEVREIVIQPNDEFLILACDGIFEQNMSRQNAVDIVKKSLALHKSPDLAAQDLVQAAYKKGSGDNLTAIVITFGNQEPELPIKLISNQLKLIIKPLNKVRDWAQRDIIIIRELLKCINYYADNFETVYKVDAKTALKEIQVRLAIVDKFTKRSKN